ncbi:MAG: hypothetical protein ABI700_27890, partial [Chloroflexota bacterium]
MKTIFALLTLLLLLPFATHAQDASDWQVVVYADGSNALEVLSSKGIVQSIAAGSLPLRVGTFPSAPLVAITSDRRALATLNFTPYQRLTVTIADHGTCCKTVRLADTGVVLANIGGFSPNGRRFVVSYLAVTDEAAHQFQSAIVTIDVELGAVISRLENQQIGGDYALLRGWNDDGIAYLPMCYGCDQPPAGSLSRWNPDTGDVTPNLSYYDAAQDTLRVTGETIAPAHRPDFPLPIQDAANTLNVLTFGDNARVIYYNPNSLQINAAHWVADGWEILVEFPDGLMLLDRAGAKHPINSGDQFLVGTPDGWLGTRPGASNSIEVVHHTLTNLDGKVIARFYQPISVIQAPPLGATATQGGFPDIASPVRAITCPNTLEPRLIAGGKGRVIGGGINLRRDPSLTSSTISMITTEVFDVIAG